VARVHALVNLGFDMRLAGRWGAAGPWGIAVALMSSLALAQELDLTWTAPAECPQATAAEARVQRLVGADAAASVAASVSLQKLAENRWSATLALGDATRVLEGESCDSVADAVVVILAMAIDPKAATASPPVPAAEQPAAQALAAAPAGPVAAPPEPAPPRSAPAAARRNERPPDAIADVAPVSLPSRELAPWGASLRGFGEWGMLPAPSLGGVVAVHATWGGSNLAELSALALLPRDEVVEGGTSGGEFSWFGLQLMACRRLAPPAFVCGGFEGGRLSGTGFGAREVRTQHTFWAAPGAELSFAPALGSSLAFEASAGLFIALRKPEFALDGVGVVHQPGPVSGRVELGIGWY